MLGGMVRDDKASVHGRTRVQGHIVVQLGPLGMPSMADFAITRES